MPTLPNDPELSAAAYDYCERLWDSTIEFARVGNWGKIETSHVQPWEDVSPAAQAAFIRLLTRTQVVAALAECLNLAANSDHRSRN